MLHQKCYLAAALNILPFLKRNRHIHCTIVSEPRSRNDMPEHMTRIYRVTQIEITDHSQNTRFKRYFGVLMQFVFISRADVNLVESTKRKSILSAREFNLELIITTFEMVINFRATMLCNYGIAKRHRCSTEKQFAFFCA